MFAVTRCDAGRVRVNNRGILMNDLDDFLRFQAAILYRDVFIKTLCSIGCVYTASERASSAVKFFYDVFNQPKGERENEQVRDPSHGGRESRPYILPDEE